MRGFKWAAVPLAAAATLVMTATMYADGGGTGPNRPPGIPFGTAFWQAVAHKVGVPAARLEAAITAQLRSGGGPKGPTVVHIHAAAADELAIGQYVVQTAATYIGVTPATLAKDIAAGSSIEAVAQARHKPLAGLAAVENKAVADVLKTKG